MSYQVTARKWRPMVFEDVVGQSHVTATLRNAIATNRLAHAYIFSGARGCGKTTTARILAKAINCLSPTNMNPDNTCDVCQEITAGRSLDVIEIDGASNRGVEEIRNLRESVRYTPTRGKYKVYIIDEVHMLTKEAFNALLKTLEEPPEHVIFIFATTEVHKIPMTILSRCQRFDFRRIGIEEMMERLRFIAREEEVTIDEEALLIIAKKGDGSMRDAQSIFDQLRSYCGNDIKGADVLKVLNAVDQEVYFRVTDLIKEQNLRGGIELVDELMRKGYDVREFLGGLAEHLRNLLIVLTTDSTDLVETSEPYKKRYREAAGSFTQSDMLRLIKLTNDLDQSIRWSPQPRFKLEAGLLQMIKLHKAVEISSLLRRIDELKKKLSEGEGSGNKGDTTPKRAGSSLSTSSKAEVKVVGQVSAGKLQSSAAISYASFREMATRSSSSPFGVDAIASIATATIAPPAVKEIPAETTPMPTGETITSLSVDEAYEHWNRWVGEVQKTKIGIGTILSQSSLLDIADGALRIGCPDDFHLSSLKRNKEFLTDTFHKVSGHTIRIEPVLHTAPRKPESASSAKIFLLTESKPRVDSVEEGVSAPSTNQKDQQEEHPVVAALIRELGAERLP
jgi:DNA polymerase-3 subunit gamma/tau